MLVRQYSFVFSHNSVQKLYIFKTVNYNPERSFLLNLRGGEEGELKVTSADAPKSFRALIVATLFVIMLLNMTLLVPVSPVLAESEEQTCPTCSLPTSLPTASHYVKVSVVDEEILLQIEPMPMSTSECPSCESQSMFVNLTVLEQEEDHIVMLLVYEFNGTTLEVTITTTRLWSYAELNDECNRTATFMKTEIAIQDESWQFYSLSYLVQREEYILTLYTRLKPLNPEIFETSFTEMNYAPNAESKVVSMEFVEFNSSVTLSKLYAVLGKVAKEIGKVYEKSGNETLAQLAQSYYTMEEEAKYLSKLVEKQLKEYDLEILESSAILMDHPVTCTEVCYWILWWKICHTVCIDWCDVLCSILFTVLCGTTCTSLLCIYVPPLCPYAYFICDVGCGVGELGCYGWCVEQFNCPVHWLTE